MFFNYVSSIGWNRSSALKMKNVSLRYNYEKSVIFHMDICIEILLTHQSQQMC